MSDHEMEVDEAEEEQESKNFIKLCIFYEEMLPTTMDVLSRISLAHTDRLEDENKSELLEFFIPNITQEVVAIWEKTSIPIVTEQGVILKMKRLIQKYRKNKSNKNRSNYKNFIVECEELFDIARCKCKKDSCKCCGDDKIPGEFIDFIADQRGERKLRMTPFCESLSLSKFLTIENDPSATRTDNEL